MKIRVDRERLNPGQLEYLTSLVRFILMSGGLGCGKSTADTLKILQLNSANRGLPGLVIAQTWGATWSNLVEPLISGLAQSVPEQLLPRVADKGGSSPRLVFPDGSFAYLGSAESPKGYDGKSVAWVVADGLEHWSENAYNIAIARMRIATAPRPQFCGTANPKIGFLSDEYNTGKKNRQLIVVSTLENAKNLREGYIDDLRASYSPRLARAMIDGEFTVLSGSVFDDFDPGKLGNPWIMDWQPTRQDLDRMPVHLAVDFGFRRSSYLWICQRGPRDWVCFDQMQLEDASDTMQIDAANKRGYPVDEVWCDPAGNATQSATALDSFAAMRMIKTRNSKTRPLRIITGPFRDIRFGIDKLRVLLGGYQGVKPSLRFTKKLVEGEQGKIRGIVKSLQCSTYPEQNGRATSDEPTKDGVYDHDRDCARYWAVGRWLTDPVLRQQDVWISQQKSVGYNVS